MNLAERPGGDLTSRPVNDPEVIGRDRNPFLDGREPAVVAVVEVSLAVDLPDIDRSILAERVLPEGGGVIPELLPHRLNSAVEQLGLRRPGDIQRARIDVQRATSTVQAPSPSCDGLPQRTTTR